MVHMQTVLGQNMNGLFSGSSNADPRTLHRVNGAHIAASADLNDIASTMKLFRETLLSKLDWADKEQGISDIGESIEKTLKSTKLKVLSAYCFLSFGLTTTDRVEPRSRFARAWAVCPKAIPLKDLCVARETKNGSLSLVAVAGLDCKVLAYLTVTDNKSGTLLVRTDERGLVNLRLDSPRSSLFQSGGAGEPKTTGDREMRFRVAMDPRSMLAMQFGYAS